MMIVNASTATFVRHSSLRPSSHAVIRWPVEETGRYSVTPSTIPRMTASSRFMDPSVRAVGGRGREPALSGSAGFADCLQIVRHPGKVGSA